MSRGPGRLQQAIIRAFDENPTAVFCAKQIVELAFPRIEHETKHRVAAIRAARTLVSASNKFAAFGGPQAGGLLLVNATNTRSLAIGRIFNHFAGTRSVAECAAFLDDPCSDAHAEARPDGFFDLLARRNALWLDGRNDEAEILSARIRERVEQARQERSAQSVPSTNEVTA